MDYKKILPLRNEDRKLASTELASLGVVWQKKFKEIEKSKNYQDFLIKLKRKWAIETGIVERLYVWDRGVTEILINEGITLPAISNKSGLGQEKSQNAYAMIQDHESVINGLFDFIKEERPLDSHFIRSLHSEFTKNQENTEAITADGKKQKIALLKGDYKKLPNNPKRNGDMHYYCPPEFVQEEIEQLLFWYTEEVEKQTAPEVLSAWLHHRFTQIHPFQDGNGRMARALASLVLLKNHFFPLVIRDSDRTRYIESLESADQGNLSTLVALFIELQKKELLSALNIEKEIQTNLTEEILDSAIKHLEKQKQKHRDELKEVYATAKELQQITLKEVKKIEKQLYKKIKKISSSFYTYVAEANFDNKKNYYFKQQIVEIAHQFDYYANLDDYKSWVRLSIKTKSKFSFVLSFHTYGYASDGIMVVSAFVFQQEENNTPDTGLEAVKSLFQFNYKEKQEDTIKRFKDWLEQSITNATMEWHKTISKS